MNKKGELGFGLILTVFIGILVGVIIFQAVAQNVGDATNTFDVANVSVSSTNGTTLANIVQFTNARQVSSVVVYNGSDDLIIGSGNYTIYNNQVINGELVSGINVSSDSAGGLQTQAWNVSYTAQPQGYIDDSGGRAVAAIIVLLTALGIAVIALVPSLRSEVMKYRK